MMTMPLLSLNSVVTLNVSGTQFVTTRQTLSDLASMLAKMIDLESDSGLRVKHLSKHGEPLQPVVMID